MVNMSFNSQSQENFPLSFGQERMWFLDQLDQGNPAYNIRGAVEIDGLIDLELLQASVNDIVPRHAILRTSFHVVNQQVCQSIIPTFEVELPVVNLEHLSREEQNWEVQRLAGELVQTRFYLDQAPLWRILCVRLQADKHMVVLCMHHIICDGDWSLGIFFHEMAVLYEAKLHNQPSPLPPLPLQYYEFAQWQQQQWQNDGFQEQGNYWLQQLGNDIPVLQLPYSHSRPLIQTYTGASCSLTLPLSLTQELEVLAQTQGVSLFTVLLTAFQVLLYRHSGQNQIMVGTPMPGRSCPGTEQLIGYFGNPVVLQAQVGESSDFWELLSQQAENVINADEYQDYPFQKLVEELKLRRDLSYSPLFQVLFLLRDDLVATKYSSFTLTPVDISSESVAYDWFVSLQNTPGGLNCVWEYNSDLFTAASIERAIQHFQELLIAVVEQPRRKVGELNLLTLPERHELLVEYNSTQRLFSVDCVDKLFTEQVIKNPQAVALTYENDDLTYGELNQRADEIAGYLQELGVGAETLVGVCMERSPALIVAILAVFKSGAVYVPLDPSYPEERLQYIIGDASITVLLTTSNLPIITEVERVVYLDQLPSRADTAVKSISNPENLAYLIYTSGSTGQPKGVMMTHEALANMVNWHLRQRRGKVRTLQFASISFDLSLHEIFSTLCSGGTLVLISEDQRRNPQELVTVICQQQIQKLYLPFIALQQIAEAWQQEQQPTALAEIITAGEQLQITAAIINLCEQNQCQLHNHYGATEVPEIATYTLPAHPQQWATLPPIGRAIDNIQIYILDEHLQPTPKGVPGQIYVGGKGIAKGYWNRPQLTESKFIPNPYGAGNLYQTGDVARYLENGNIEHLGRIDKQVKIRGFRIEPGEIEILLTQHPAVAEAVVTVWEPQPGDKRLVGYIVATSGEKHQSLEKTLHQYLQQNLPYYMIPAPIVVLEKMPLTPSGKINRSALPTPNNISRDKTAALTLPQSEAEKLIADIWQQILQIQHFGIDDNFFELGGNSLLLTQVHKQLTVHWASDLSPVTLFQYPTIRSLAQYLTQETPLRSQSQGQLTQYRDIAIIGMAGKFPGADNIEAFWQNLCEGVESISFFSEEELETSYFTSHNHVKAGAVLTNIDLFDAEFFGYSPREAELTDPQQRIFLETAWQAFENAGYNPKTHSQPIGVFAGTGTSTYLINYLYPALGFSGDNPVLEHNSLLARLGNEGNYFSTRVSYKLNLTGPSLNVQTACSTSLVAVHLACASLQKGECDMALAGGVSLVVPQKTGYIYQPGMIHSPDGHCRTFDAQAQGTIFGSGCGVVILKPLEKALADHDHIYAVIKGSAVNNDGNLKVSYTAPSITAQANVVNQALTVASINSDTIGYVEAHGTATPLGDPIEVTALTQAFRQCSQIQRNKYCAIGSVKTNVGHLDEAAGITGLIKTALAVYHNLIPPVLHFQTPNPNIDFDNSPFYVNTRLNSWASSPRRAGVSSFGMGGTNCHVVLEQAPSPTPLPAFPDRTHHLLTLSAKTESSLQHLIQEYTNHLHQHLQPNLADICFTANTGREHYPHRACFIASTVEQLQEQLENISTQPPAFSESKTIAFLFTGQGSQYPQMALQLYQTQPTFRRIIDECDQILRPYLPVPLLSVLYPEKQDTNNYLQQTAYTQPALYAVEYALAELWHSWGVIPQMVMGHSLGEYVAAALAGVFTWQEGLKLVATRGKLIQSLPDNGEMVALLASPAQIKPLLANSQISLAAINGEQSIVVSGERQAVHALIAKLETIGIKYKKLPISHAFHSALMEPMVAEFRQVLQQVKFSDPRLKIISNITGELIGSEIASPEYWCRHLLEPVQFASSVKYLAEQQVNIFLEIGPRPTLSVMGHQCLPQYPCLWLSSLQKDQEDWQILLTSLGQLYLQRIAINWLAFDQDYPRYRVVLPGYAFQRQRYWIEKTHQLTSFSPNTHPLLGKELSLAATTQVHFHQEISQDKPCWLADHRVWKKTIVPGTAYVEIAIAAAKTILKDWQFYLEDVVISQALTLPVDNSSQVIQTILTPVGEKTYDFAIYSRTESNWTVHAGGKISAGDVVTTDTIDLATAKQICPQAVPLDLLHQRHQQQQIDYGSSFLVVQEIYQGQGALGKIVFSYPDDFNRYYLHPILLDGCLQVLDVTLMDKGGVTYVPVGVGSLQIFAPPTPEIWCYAHLEKSSKVLGNLCLFTPRGELIAVVSGVQMQPVRQSSWEISEQKTTSNWFYEVEWRLEEQVSTFESYLVTPQHWLILADQQGVAEQLAQLLQEQQHQCTLVFLGSHYQQLHQQKYIINPTEPGHCEELLTAIAGVDGIVNVWGLEVDVQAVDLCAGTLHLLQAVLQKYHPLPRLWLVTQGAQSVNYGSMVKITGACLGGMSKVIQLEYPDFQCVQIDLDPHNSQQQLQQLWAELQITPTAVEQQVAIRDHHRYVARLAQCHWGEPWQLAIKQRGSLDALEVEGKTREQPQAGEVEILVEAAGVNFIDVLNVLGLYPGEPPLGIECVGKVVTVGDGVEGLHPGMLVMALAVNTFSQYVTVDADLVTPIPACMSRVAAASIPVAFVTAYWCLHHIAKVAPGDRVLIHAATGGVGLAAVQIAQQAQAVVLATASPQKWATLEKMGVQYIMNSRSLEFGEEVMNYTDNQGVNIVLNSLTSPGFIETSLNVLAAEGRFVEIGKRDIWTPSQVANYRPDVFYNIVDLGKETEAQPSEINCIFRRLGEMLQQGKLTPLPTTVFPFSQYVSAFRYMQQGKHIGKIVLTFPRRIDPPSDINFTANATYLITGGLGDLGLLTAEWMVENGAKNIVLLTRSSHKQLPAHLKEKWAEKSGQVMVICADVANYQQLAEVFTKIQTTLPPLRGVIHAAGVTDDGIIPSQTQRRFAEVMAAKVTGAENLHSLTENLDLDFFLLFSSSSSLMGTPGQSNYAAANAFLDALAAYRRGEGMTGLSINWGAWSEIGMTARRDLIATLAAKGEGSITPSQGLQVLGQLMFSHQGQIGVMPINWRQFWEQQPQHISFLADFHEQATVQECGELVLDGKEALMSYVSKQIAKVLGLSGVPSWQPTQKLMEIGLDSLMVIELRSYLQTSLSCSLPSTLILDYPTIGSLVDHLYEILHRSVSKQGNSTSCLVPIQTHGEKPPIYFVPGVLGNVLDLYPLAQCLGNQQPLYGLRSLGLEPGETPLTNIHDIAASHVRSIQAIQPQGAYILVGHSFGGRVAWEMSQHLQQQGQSVSRLILMDAWMIKTGSDEKPTDFLMELAQLYAGVLGATPPREQLQQLSHLQRYLETAGLKLTISELERIYQVYQANTQAFGKYVPQQKNYAPITLVRAGEVGIFDFLPDENTTAQRPDWGWQDFSSEVVEVRLTPGNHFTMLVEGNVEKLAQLIKGILRT